MVSNRSLSSSQQHAEYNILAIPKDLQKLSDQKEFLSVRLSEYTFSTDFLIETMSENTDTGPAKCLIPQMSTVLEKVELESMWERCPM